MTAKKAIEMIDEFVRIKRGYRDTMANPYRSWNTCGESIRGFVKNLAEETAEEIEILELVKQEIEPKCEHPKNMRDLDPETRKPYCVACNWDL